MPDEVYFSTCSHADAVEIDNTTIYDSPTQCLNLYTIPEEGEKEKGEEEELDYHNPTYEALDCASAECEVAVESQPTLLESATFDDEIYSKIN